MTKPLDIRLWRSRDDDPHLLPRGRLLVAAFMLALPNAATTADVEEWLRLNLCCGTMAIDNPLSHFAPEAFGGIVKLVDLKSETNYPDAIAELMADAVARGAQEVLP